MVVLVRVLLVLLAMRVFAWAGWTRMGAEEPTAVTMSRMPQASATHADQVPHAHGAVTFLPRM